MLLPQLNFVESGPPKEYFCSIWHKCFRLILANISRCLQTFLPIKLAAVSGSFDCLDILLLLVSHFLSIYCHLFSGSLYNFMVFDVLTSQICSHSLLSLANHLQSLGDRVSIWSDFLLTVFYSVFLQSFLLAHLWYLSFSFLSLL